MDSSEVEKARKTLKEIEKLKNAANQSLVDTSSPEAYNIQIKPDKSVGPGKFKASASQKSIYYAHPQTIRAMKKNIFALGDDIDELASPYTCQSCQAELDLQFWHFCPYCGEQF